MSFAFTMGMEAIFGDSAGKVEEVWEAVRKLTEAFVELAERGDEVSDAMQGVQPRMIELAKAATGGEVSAVRLAQSLQRLRFAGLEPTEEQFAAIAKTAKAFGDRLGIDTPAATEQLGRALVSLNDKGLGQFDIHVDSNLSRAEKFRQAMAQLTEHADNLTEGQTTLGDSITHLNTAWNDLTDAFARGLTEGHSIENLITHLATLLEGAAYAAEVFGRGVAAAMNMPGVDLLLRAMARFGPNVEHEVRSTAVPQEPAAGSIGALSVQEYPSSAEIPGRVPARRGGGGGRRRRGPDMDFTGELSAQAAFDQQQLDEKRQYESDMQDLRDASNKALEDSERLKAAITEDWWNKARAQASAEIAWRKQVEAQKLQAARQSVQDISQIAMLSAQLLGAGKRDLLYIEGLTQAALAAVSFATPGGQLAGVAHALAAALAFKGAQEVASYSGASGKGAPAGASTGGGTGIGAGPSAFNAGAQQGGGGNTIIVNVPGTLAGARDVEDAILAGITRAHDRGNYMPDRVLRRAA